MGDLAAHQLRQYTEPAREDAQPWVDLSLNRPGDGLRARAAAERKARFAGVTPGWPAAHREAEHRWQLGYEGEKLIGHRLDRMAGRGWHTLHSVNVGDLGCDIDHVLIGPGGVFTINTKHRPGQDVHVHPDQILVHRRDSDYVEKSRHEGRRASRLLSAAVGTKIAVQPVLVFHGHRSLTVHRPAEGVLVLESFAVPAAFRSMRPRVDDAVIAAIFEQARRSTTWS